MYRFTLILIVGMTTWAANSAAQDGNLGKIDFRSSGDRAAQEDFVRGVLYLHSFEYDLAAQAFRKAQSVDPDFAMAYWGEAMTNHHSLWTVNTRRQGETFSCAWERLSSSVLPRRQHSGRKNTFMQSRFSLA
jgi:hypothetical protein